MFVFVRLLSFSFSEIRFHIHFQESERVVSREEGITLAKEHGCLFLECSAKTRENVEQCFEELALKVKKNILCFIHGSCGICNIYQCRVGK